MKQNTMTNECKDAVYHAICDCIEKIDLLQLECNGRAHRAYEKADTHLLAKAEGMAEASSVLTSIKIKYEKNISPLEFICRRLRDSEPGMEDKSWKYWLPSARAALYALSVLELPDTAIKAAENSIDQLEVFRAIINSMMLETIK